jgi:hypothetical protein
MSKTREGQALDQIKNAVKILHSFSAIEEALYYITERKEELTEKLRIACLQVS